MSYIKNIAISFLLLLILIIVLLILLLIYQIFKIKIIPEPGSFERTILFTETGCKIFRIENKSTGYDKLVDIFDNNTINIIKKNNYEISIALDEFNKENAEGIKILNNNNIKVWIWPLLDIKDGYWLSMDNANKVYSLYERLKQWIFENNLRINGIMLDMEPTYQAAQDMKNIGIEKGTTGIIKYLLKRKDNDLYKKALKIYSNIIKMIKSDGFETSTFNYPYVLDDKIDHDTSIQEMFHIIYVKSDISIFMLYRSFFKDSGLGLDNENIISYALSLKNYSMAIGSYMEDYLSFENFEDDVRIASRYSKIIHIYNIESLIKKGWFNKLENIDLNKSIKIKLSGIFKITSYRFFFWFIDIINNQSKYFFIGFILLIWLFFWYFVYLKFK